MGAAETQIAGADLAEKTDHRFYILNIERINSDHLNLLENSRAQGSVSNRHTREQIQGGI
jgi:hypothetical protein